MDCFNPKLIIYDTDVGRLLLKRKREGKKIQFMPYKFGELYLRSLLYCPHSTFPMYFGFALISIKNLLLKKKKKGSVNCHFSNSGKIVLEREVQSAAKVPALLPALLK